MLQYFLFIYYIIFHAIKKSPLHHRQTKLSNIVLFDLSIFSTFYKALLPIETKTKFSLSFFILFFVPLYPNQEYEDI